MDEGKVGAEQSRSSILGGQALLEAAGGLNSLKDGGLDLRIRNKPTIDPIIGVACKVGLGDQKFLCELGDLIIVRRKDGLEGIVYRRDTILGSDQVPKARDDI